LTHAKSANEQRKVVDLPIAIVVFAVAKRFLRHTIAATTRASHTTTAARFAPSTSFSARPTARIACAAASGNRRVENGFANAEHGIASKRRYRHNHDETPDEHMTHNAIPLGLQNRPMH
jgi:hypothetical protein